MRDHDHNKAKVHWRWVFSKLSVVMSVLDFTEVAKSLDVLIDNKLSWESHIDKLHKSFSAQLKRQKRMKFLQVNNLKIYTIK